MFKAIFGSKPVSTMEPAKPFIKFDGTKLRLEQSLNIPNLESVKVLSILGKARMGKSTFLNAIVSKLCQENVKVFNCQTGIEHCTIGVDYCYLPEQNLLLLDSQGLANGDAQHDPALLLFIYLISDIIIFNDSKILQNEALKLIEPICAFMTYIEDMEQKPHLIFRLSDGKLVKDTKKNLDNVLAAHEDQYQSIRNSIVELFEEPIQLVKTETLDRNEENLMDNCNYLDMLAIPDNGFDNTIEHILSVLSTTKSKPNVLSKLSDIVEMINTNSKITIDKLDVVGLLATNEVMSWVNEVDPSLYAPLTVNGTQEQYEKVVEPRIADVKKKIAAFKRRFNKVSANLKNKHLSALEQKLQEPIRIAKENSEQKAEAMVAFAVANYLNNNYILKELDSISGSLTLRTDTNIRENYLNSFNMLKTACTSVYDPVRIKYTKFAQAADDELFKAVKFVREKEQKECEEVSNFFDAFITDFQDWIEMKIETIGNKSLLSTNTDITTAWFQEIISLTQDFIKKTVHTHTISSNFVEKKLTSNIRVNKSGINIMWDLISPMYTTFIDNITSLIKSDEIEQAMNATKERLMDHKIFMNPLEAKQIYLKNPGIDFVYDSVLLNCMIKDPYDIKKTNMPYMTKQTWESVFVPFYKVAMKSLILKGIVKQSDEYNTYIISIPEGNIYNIQLTGNEKSDFYDKNVCDLILNQLKEIYCKKRVEGFVFPEHLDITSNEAHTKEDITLSILK